VTEKETGEILVAQDGSPAALAAAAVGIQIARSEDLPVRGLYVVDETLALDIYANYRRELDSDNDPASRAELLTWLEEQGDAALQRLAVRCQAAGVPLTAELVAGAVPEMILRASEQAQLLAIGRRGHVHEDDSGHLGRSFRSVAHRAHLPIVIGGNQNRTVRRLLLAYDGRKHAKSALAWASQLERTLPADVTVVAVQENGLQATEEWLAEARSQLASSLCVPRLGQPAGEIMAVAEQTEADLIVMGRYRHPALLEWLVGSTVDRVLRGTEIPVMIV
jgi:nucleotide-binding universal stress UspA family protein